MRLEKSQTNATNVTMPLLMHSVWGDIWKCTPEKSHTNATNVTMLLLIQAIWRHKWKPKLEKSKTNATNVTMSALIQAIWRHIRKPTVEKGQTNATNVTMLLLGKAIWGHIWKKTDEITQPFHTQLWIHLKTHMKNGELAIFIIIIIWPILAWRPNSLQNYKQDRIKSKIIQIKLQLKNVF